MMTVATPLWLCCVTLLRSSSCAQRSLLFPRCRLLATTFRFFFPLLTLASELKEVFCASLCVSCACVRLFAGTAFFFSSFDSVSTADFVISGHELLPLFFFFCFPLRPSGKRNPDALLRCFHAVPFTPVFAKVHVFLFSLGPHLGSNWTFDVHCDLFFFCSSLPFGLSLTIRSFFPKGVLKKG